MQIVCPSCDTAYRVDVPMIGGGGRSVRCARCKTVWTVAPPAEQAAPPPAEAEKAVATVGAELGGTAPPAAEEPLEPVTGETSAAPAKAAANPDVPPPSTDSPAADATDASAPAPSAPPAKPATEAPAEPDAAVALSDIPIPVENAPPLAPTLDNETEPGGRAPIENNRQDIESAAVLRRSMVQARRGQGRRRAVLPVIITILAVVCAALLLFRKNIVRHVPQLASFYSSIGLSVNLRGLTFTDLRVGHETHDGVPVLVVEGNIVNTVSGPVDVPRLRFALRNAAGAEVYAWTAQPPKSILEPGATMPFRSRLASPPDDGHDVEVRFFTRHDVVTGGR